MDAFLLDLACALPHDPTAERVLTAELEEIRWSHSGVRVCCGAFFRESALRIVASSQPSAMQSLAGSCVFGEAVHRYRGLLEATDELSSEDVPNDSRLVDMPPTILGEDTRAAVALPLRARNQTLGFLRIDAIAPGQVTPKTLEALRGAINLGVLAVSLEAELVTSHERSRHILQARRWIHQRLTREHEAIDSLRGTLDTLTRTLVHYGTRLDADAKRALEFAVEDVDRRLEAIAAGLDRHARDARDSAFFPRDASETLMHNRRRDAVETPSESVPSTGETPE